MVHSYSYITTIRIKYDQIKAMDGRSQRTLHCFRLNANKHNKTKVPSVAHLYHSMYKTTIYWGSSEARSPLYFTLACTSDKKSPGRFDESVHPIELQHYHITTANQKPYYLVLQRKTK